MATCSGCGCPQSASSYGTSSGGHLRPQFGTLFCYGPLDRRALHFTLVVDDHTCVVLEINEHSFGATPCFFLANAYGLEHLLLHVRLALLDRAQAHVARASRGNSVQATTIPFDSHNVDDLRAAVVGTTHLSGDMDTQAHPEFSHPAGFSAFHVGGRVK